MQETQKVLYEYFLNDGEVRQTTCTVISEKEHRGHGKIYQYERVNIYGSRFISEESLGKVMNNHIYAFDDDVNKYRKVFIEYVEANIKNLQQKMKRNKNVLKKLQQVTKSIEN